MLLFVALSLLTIILMIIARSTTGTPKRHPKGIRDAFDVLPNVSRIPYFGGCLQLCTLKPDNLHLKFGEFVRRYGKTFTARVVGMSVIVTADSHYVDRLLTSQQHVRKHFIYNMLGNWLGSGLLLSYGQAWQVMRKIITPTFHFRILEEFVKVFDSQSEILVEKLNEYADGSTQIDIFPFIGLAALDIITETAMGVRVYAQLDDKSDIVQAVKDVTNILATRFVRPHLAHPVTFRLLWPNGYRKQLDGIHIMHKFTDEIIERRRRMLQEQTTDAGKATLEYDDTELGIKQHRMALLDVLLQARVQDVPLTDKQIRDEVNTFVFEGHDTTTSAMSFCLYLISRHADVQARLFAEICAHFGVDRRKRSICYADLQELNYLHCVIKETLRIYPPIPAIGRWLKEDWILDDLCIPAGTNIIIMLWELLRDPKVYPEPEVFRPERHLAGTDETTPTQAYTYIPFSAGPRNCIGQRFALYEMKTVIVKILQHYELLPLGEDVQPCIKIVLRSKNGVNLALKPRNYNGTEQLQSNK